MSLCLREFRARTIATAVLHKLGLAIALQNYTADRPDFLNIHSVRQCPSPIPQVF